MPKLKLTLETVTPLFLGGADPRGQPELRAPAFRGAMRYWLRAALGGGGKSLAEVRDVESQVFGYADERGSSASPLTVQLTSQVEPTIREFTRQSRDRPGTGRDYLYWAAAATRQDRARSYIQEGHRFHLYLGDRSNGEPGQVLLPALASAWLLLHLGGVGARSRRTAGSLVAAAEPTVKGLAWRLTGSSAEEVARELSTGIRRIRRTLKLSEAAPPDIPTEYDILAPGGCSIYVLGVWPTVAAAVEAAGSALRDFRGKHPLSARVAFGLPIRDLDVKVGQDPVRRASPLWMKVSRVKGGYACVATVFRSRLLPEGVVGPHDLPSNHDLLDRFVTECFPDHKEVRFG